LFLKGREREREREREKREKEINDYNIQFSKANLINNNISAKIE